MRAAFEAGAGWGQATPMTTLHLYHAVHDKYPLSPTSTSSSRSTDAKAST